MRKRISSSLVGCFLSHLVGGYVAAGLILAAGIAQAETKAELTTESWPYGEAGFAAMNERIQAMASRNLLARPGVKSLCNGRDGADAWLLVDGDAGQMGGAGRVFPQGSPATFAFYLGGLKAIREVGVFSFNGDTRSNQIFTVRFADNSARPGVRPSFPRQADCSSGDKVLGQDRGGFHSRFRDPQEASLAKADWVEFQIWPTLGLKCGEPAFKSRAKGDCVVVELEVLGEEHDVQAPSPEEVEYRRLLRTTPKEPAFVKQETWQETLIAAREALLQWENIQDGLALHQGPVNVGPWYLLGPLSPKSKDIAQLQSAKAIDLDRRYSGEDGQELGWQRRDDLQDGQLHDLAGCGHGSQQAVYFLCRTVALQAATQRNQVACDLAADRGTALWLPDRRGLAVQRALPLVTGGSDLGQQSAGDYQILLKLEPGASGQQRFYFALKPSNSRPGAGAIGQRVSARQRLLARVTTEFTDPHDLQQMRWEMSDDVWGSPRSRTTEDWLPGSADVYLKARYRAAVKQRLQKLSAILAETAGVKALAVAGVKNRVQAWHEALQKSLGPELATDQLREKLYQVAMVEETVVLAGRTHSMRLAVEDHRQMFQDRYPQAREYLGRITALEARLAAQWKQVLANQAAALQRFAALKQDLDAAQAEILLDTPLLAFGQLLIVKGHPGFASNWSGPNRLGNELVRLSPVRPDGQQTTVYKGNISDLDLHWDGQRLLFSDGRVLQEMHVNGSHLRRVSAEDPPVTHYDGCYLPDGRIVCASNSPEQAVPCTGGPDVGNLHLLDADGTHERRVTFDQDHDWNPVVLNDGRVLYSRWEYTDLPHYFSRLLFRMNPDGSGQMEYYGSGSYWPNAMYWPRPIPGHPTAVVCIVSGHHGVSRAGELLLLDPARGRHEADGVIQRIPGYQQKVEPVIQDQLVLNVWPKFAAPYPLAEDHTNLGAGKYFLACVQQDSYSTWDLYLVDIFDNLTPILTGGWMTPIPLRPRPLPPVIPSNLNPQQKDGVIYLADIYQGDGLRGYPRGSIKALRVGTHHYRYPGNGDTRASTYEGGWDVKRILGTVPVREDGSALFRVPANTPIFLQPLDADGKAQQQMRSWYTAMPGETASCIGCHERQNSGPPAKYSAAARAKPCEITPWNGPARGFSFDREVQPVLDRKCAGCHNGQPYRDGERTLAAIDLRAKRLRPEYKDNYSPAYMELQRYVRRAGYEADWHLPAPAEYEADTSVLVQMLKKGHYNVELSRDEWERLYTWIDYNVPYPANWRESHRPPRDEQVELRKKYKQLFAAVKDRDEEPLPLLPVAKFEPPKPLAARPAALTCENWPLTAEQAVALQKSAGPSELALDLGHGVTLPLSLIPAGRFVMGHTAGFADEQPQSIVTIDRPFYLGRMEVTNRQYAQFDARHESGYIDGRGKDRTTRGTSVEGPDQPVVQISWNEALTFCEWLSQKTGFTCTLPTEAHWEWACRAGTDSAYSFGDYPPVRKDLCNIADSTIAGWNYGRSEAGYSDGAAYSIPGGKYPPNAWGLCDMHGNVAEWCLSAYQPYPYRTDDGRDDPHVSGLKVVRGGSWNDTMGYVTSASRWRYPAYQPVYNVGFRVLVWPKSTVRLATAGQ